MLDQAIRYSRARRIQLAKEIKPLKKVYLDLCFWIKLRDVRLGTNQDKSWLILHHLLRRGVNNGLLLCPISSATFSELMKQRPTPDRRVATAALIDELSLGVSLVRQDQIKEKEVTHAVRVALGDNGDLPPEELVWTKVAYTLGEAFPTLATSSNVLSPEFHLMFFDVLWNQPLVSMAIAMGETEDRTQVWKSLSDEANAKCAQFSDEITSYHRAYEIELSGAADCFGHAAGSLFADRYLNQSGKPADHEERLKLDGLGVRTIYHGMSVPKFRRIMRSIFIGASVHAGIRWDKGRRYKPNDWFDLQHAVAAVGYCDALFTEKPLHHLLVQPQLQLSDVSDCSVCSDVIEAIGIVRSMLKRPISASPDD